MCGCKRQINLGFTDMPVEEGQHIAYIFNDNNERRKTMAKYLNEGLLAGEKVLYLADELTPDEMRSELTELGVDLRDKTEDDLTLVESEKGYCPEGFFSSDYMLDVVGSFYNNAKEQGYVGARGSGEMGWALTGDVNMLELIEYEAKLTSELHKFPYTAICQYDAREFTGEMIMDVLNVHPVMIVRGQLVRNPCYMPPEQFLKEYKARQQK